MSDEDSELIVVEDNKLSRKRGLDISKVEFVMGREQERDLAFLYRFDQIRLFDKCPPEAKKQFNYKLKPSDQIPIQLLFEIKDQYNKAKEDGDQKTALQYMKMMCDIAARAEDRRDRGLDRLFAWKKQAEATGKGLGDMTTEELEKLADGTPQRG